LARIHQQIRTNKILHGTIQHYGSQVSESFHLHAAKDLLPEKYYEKKKKTSKTSGLDSSLCLAFRRETIILNTYA